MLVVMQEGASESQTEAVIGAEVPPWPADDYDSLYVLRLGQHNAANPISFTHDHEGLNGLSADCP
jgi:hypothetical protein